MNLMVTSLIWKRVTRYAAWPGTVFLLRPDQHVCARWREFDLPSVRAAIARATGNA